MATIADYIVVADKPHALEEGKNVVFDITLPKNTYRTPGKARPILAYVAEPINAADLNYEIFVEDAENGESKVAKIKTGSLTGGEIRGLWEAFKFPGNSKEIKVKFKVISGEGEVKFQDIVLWFQREAQL